MIDCEALEADESWSVGGISFEAEYCSAVVAARGGIRSQELSMGVLIACVCVFQLSNQRCPLLIWAEDFGSSS